MGLRRASTALVAGLAAALASGCAGTGGPRTPGGTPAPTGEAAVTMTTAHLVAPGAGWIVFGEREGRGVLFRTVDAGATWRRVVVPGAPAGTLLYWNEVLGRDDVVVLIGPGKVAGKAPTGAPRLYATSDAGATWRPISPPGTSAAGFVTPAVDFVTPAMGWYLALPQASGPPVTLYRTTDGGAHWQTVLRVDGPGQTSHGLVYPAFGSAVTFVDAATGWLTSGRSVFVTRDGGETWAPRSITWPSASRDTSLQPPHLFDSASGVVVGVDYRSPDEYPNGNCFTYVWETGDGGATWSGPAQPADPGGAAAVFSFVDRDHRYMTPATSSSLPPGPALFTWTAGTRRAVQTSGVPQAASFVVHDFVDANNGWAIVSLRDGARSLMATADGGRSWTAVRSPDVAAG